MNELELEELEALKSQLLVLTSMASSWVTATTNFAYSWYGWDDCIPPALAAEAAYLQAMDELESHIKEQDSVK
jgi:ABC-type nitrate/sulfonate/bicarbonate transport system substrate-binding protein